MIDAFKLQAAVQQLRQVATYIEDLVPAEDSHLPKHQQLEYITRSRSFADAAAGQDLKKKAATRKKGGA